MTIGNYKTQIRERLKWYFSNRENPQPSWYYRLDGWITDSKQVMRHFRENGFEL